MKPSGQNRRLPSIGTIALAVMIVGVIGWAVYTIRESLIIFRLDLRLALRDEGLVSFFLNPIFMISICAMIHVLVLLGFRGLSTRTCHRLGWLFSLLIIPSILFSYMGDDIHNSMVLRTVKGPIGTLLCLGVITQGLRAYSVSSSLPGLIPLGLYYILLLNIDWILERYFLMFPLILAAPMLIPMYRRAGSLWRPARLPRLRMPKAAAQGFTLIELLIVIAIIIVVGGAPYMMIHRLDETRLYLEDRMQASRETEEALRSWRGDVERAVAIEVNDRSDEMIVAISEGARSTNVRYRQTEAGELQRVDEAAPSPSTTLARGIRKLRFERQAGAWSMSWKVPWTDGVREMTWAMGGWAAPLIPTSSNVPSKPSTTISEREAVLP